MAHSVDKSQLHPRNPHRAGYDFPALARVSPALKPFLRPGPDGAAGIDFGDARAVKALNAALLVAHYGLAWWDIPEGCLCPPVPGRADYVHHAADLLGCRRGARVLDIGVGANCVYPIVGSHAYGWRFVGAELQADSLAAASAIVARNPRLAGMVELRRQHSAAAVFRGVVLPGERFDLSLCNPPFYASPGEAAASHRQRLAKMGLAGGGRARNFGGAGAELWCPGGEAAFLAAMVDESRDFAGQVRWFTSLVSSRDTLGPLRRRLRQAGVSALRVVDMAQGNKRSRMLAWSFAEDGSVGGGAEA